MKEKRVTFCDLHISTEDSDNAVIKAEFYNRIETIEQITLPLEECSVALEEDEMDHEEKK